MSNKQLFNGAYTRTRSYFENSEMAATGLPGPDELAILEPLRDKIPGEVFTQAFEPSHTDGSGMIAPNSARPTNCCKRQAGRLSTTKWSTAPASP